jgi:hypothetical protein
MVADGGGAKFAESIEATLDELVDGLTEGGPLTLLPPAPGGEVA